ncbi:hypothetical protein [Hyalangium minutum]|uniref:hypothetical protein n=1 Tax=Hyalangium minutum TaxID=394096 RepID=UPI001969E4AC|nr:hypothetical protein [Hyalangium minutum]
MSNDEDTSSEKAHFFIQGGGEVGALMRAHDWTRSPLGPPSSWPQPLRSVVGLLLTSKCPMFVAWGPVLGFLYNDAYAEILGAKHPAALGARFRDVFLSVASHERKTPLTPMAIRLQGLARSLDKQAAPLSCNRCARTPKARSGRSTSSRRWSTTCSTCRGSPPGGSGWSWSRRIWRRSLGTW